MSSLRVTSLRGRSNGVSPTLPDGVVVTGVATATNVSASSSITASVFYGSGEGLTGVASTDNIITGTAATFNNLVNVGSNIKIDATSGIVTATSFEGSGANLSGLPEGTNILKAMLFV